jgi:hypothetical protein
MRPISAWLPAFVVLFVCYQLPEGVGARWLQQPALAAGMMLAFLPVTWLVARALGLGMGAAYALEWSLGRAAVLGVGLVLAVSVKAAALMIGLKLGIYTADAAPTDPPAGAALLGALAWLSLSTFVPSLAEDILTRGFWARLPAWRWSGPRFVSFTAVLYVLNHIYRLGNGPSEWLMLLCFGLAYGAALWRTGSLWAAVGLHWGWNFAGQALDLGWPTSITSAAAARGLSGVAHLAMLGVVMLAHRRLAMTPPLEPSAGSAVP